MRTLSSPQNTKTASQRESGLRQCLRVLPLPSAGMIQVRFQGLPRSRAESLSHAAPLAALVAEYGMRQ